MFQAIAIHHARPEHVEEFMAFMRRVLDAVGDAPGLIEFRGWRDGPTSRLVGLSAGSPSRRSATPSARS